MTIIFNTTSHNPHNSENLIKEFFKEIKDNKRDLYNEFYFQIEFGIFIKNRFPEFKVEFERNVEYLFGTKEVSTNKEFIKKEIDVIVYKDLQDEKKELIWAFELKFPRKSQTPEQMFKIVEDVLFCEELVSKGFLKATQVTLVDEDSKGKPFFEGKKRSNKIYEYFRSDSKSLEGEKPLKGIIDKPTGPKKGIQEYSHNLKGAYNIKWKRTDGLNQKIVYFFIDLQRE